MAANRILTLNIGASQITLAEFKTRVGQAPELVQYGSVPLGLDPESEMDSSAFITEALSGIMKAKGMKPAPLLMSVSGQAVFPRFVKLPPVDKDKLVAMVTYEAEQNVPFPIGEVVWDYQLIGDSADGEQNVMIVAVKTENVTSLTNSVQASGLEPETVDVAPLAIANCVQFNYPHLEDCTMVLDIGARSTNLMFLEEGRVFYRSIPVAGNTITQEIAKAFSCDFRQAEQLKKDCGHVALGGNFAAEDETAERVSKVIRNVVTRLHAEVNRSINFYRQQGGNVPVRLLLTGGSSVITYMDTFFREKLKVDVEYLNPFQAVEIGSRIDTEKVGLDFYCLCEVVGMAMRKCTKCPVEINLMPPNLVQKKAFRKRVPFFATAALLLLGAAFCYYLSAAENKTLSDKRVANVEEELTAVKRIDASIKDETKLCDEIRGDLDVYRDLVRQRTLVAQRIDAIRGALLDGMWLKSIKSAPAENGVVTKLTVTVRMFDDKRKAVERSTSGNAPSNVAGANPVTAHPSGKTAAEIFAENVTMTPVFASADDGATRAYVIRSENDVSGLEGKVREIVLDLNLAKDYTLKAVEQLGKAEK